MNEPDDNDFLPSAFVREESSSPVEDLKRKIADLNIEEEEDFSTLGSEGESPFTSIENSEEFAGLEGDVDRHIPPAQAQASHVNQYGVRVRGAKRCQPSSDDDEIVFSINMGDK